MSWQLWLAISIFCLSLNGLFHRSLLKDDKSDASAQTVVFLLLGGILTILIALFRNNLQLYFPSYIFYNFAVLGILGALAYFLKYRGFQLLDASEVIIFATTSKLWNLVGGYFFLNEEINLKKIFGSLIIIVGVVIAIYSKGKFKINQGIAFVLLSALFFGITDINGYHILKGVDATTYQIYFYFVPAITVLLFQPKTLMKLRYYLNPIRGIKVTFLSIFDVFGMLALFNSYQAGGKASVIGPLSASKVILTTLLGMLILKEHSRLTSKLVGAVVTVVGIVLLL